MATDKKELLEKIKTHFSSQARVHFYVPEWDQDVWMSPLSLREQDKINARAKDSPFQLAVYALIMKEEDDVSFLNPEKLKEAEKKIESGEVKCNLDQPEDCESCSG